MKIIFLILGWAYLIVDLKFALEVSFNLSYMIENHCFDELNQKYL